MNKKQIVNGLMSWSVFIVLSAIVALVTMSGDWSLDTFKDPEFLYRMGINIIVSKSAQMVILAPALTRARDTAKHKGLSDTIEGCSRVIVAADKSVELDDFIEEYNDRDLEKHKILDIRNRLNTKKDNERKLAQKQLKIIQNRYEFTEEEENITREEVLESIQIKHKPIQREQLFFASEVIGDTTDINIQTSKDYSYKTLTSIFGTLFMSSLVAMINDLEGSAEGWFLFCARIGLMGMGIVKGYGLAKDVVTRGEIPKLVKKVEILNEFMSKYNIKVPQAKVSLNEKGKS